MYPDPFKDKTYRVDLAMQFYWLFIHMQIVSNC